MTIITREKLVARLKAWRAIPERDTPLDVIDWTAPEMSYDNYEVSRRELTEAEWARFVELLRGEGR